MNETKRVWTRTLLLMSNSTVLESSRSFSWSLFLPHSGASNAYWSGSKNKILPCLSRRRVSICFVQAEYLHNTSGLFLFNSRLGIPNTTLVHLSASFWTWTNGGWVEKAILWTNRPYSPTLTFSLVNCCFNFSPIHSTFQILSITKTKLVLFWPIIVASPPSL